ncbi:MAG: hypothetical protein ACRC2K_05885 [Clostridium sp.]
MVNKGIRSFVILLSIACISLGYFYEQNNKIDKEEITVKIKNLPKELKGLKIVQVSDLHLPQKDIYVKRFLRKSK